MTEAPLVVDEAQIAALLQRSRAFHASYRDAADHQRKDAVRAFLAAACREREEADRLDPQQTAHDAWSEDAAAWKHVADAHRKLLNFYRQALGVTTA